MPLKLYFLLLGCKPPGRFTEQHDVFFGIASSLKELVPQIKASWPEAKGNIHIDAWREVTHVDGYDVIITEKQPEETNAPALYFLNLGGYKPDAFDEFHYKMLVAAADESEAIRKAKATAFYRDTGFKGAVSHIDDKYAVDIDDVCRVSSMLPAESASTFTIRLLPAGEAHPGDPLHLGYLQLWKIPS